MLVLRVPKIVDCVKRSLMEYFVLPKAVADRKYLVSYCSILLRHEAFSLADGICGFTHHN